MAAAKDRLSLYIPWGTLLKILAAIALVWVWPQLMWVVMLGLVAIIIAVALDPAVSLLERRGWSRPLVSWALVALIVGSLLGFLVMTWSSLASQAQDLGARMTDVERAFEQQAPKVVVDAIRRSPAPDASVLGPYALSIGRSAWPKDPTALSTSQTISAEESGESLTWARRKPRRAIFLVWRPTFRISFNPR